MTGRGRGGGEGVRTRDHLANVRTLLSFIRIGLILVGLGFVMDKLGQLEHANAPALGEVVLAIGWVLMAGAAGRFLLQRRAIEGDLLRSHVAWDVPLIGLIASGGVTVLIWLTLTR